MERRMRMLAQGEGVVWVEITDELEAIESLPTGTPSGTT
jgi:hypothetical protein